MSRYNTQVLSNIRMLCRMQNIDEKVLYERAKLILSIYREVCWSTIDRANDVCDSHELTPKEKEIWMLFDRVDVAELLARDAFAKGAYMLGAEDREIMLK